MRRQHSNSVEDAPNGKSGLNKIAIVIQNPAQTKRQTTDGNSRVFKGVTIKKNKKPAGSLITASLLFSLPNVRLCHYSILIPTILKIYSYRSASIGSSFAALLAGITPNTIPTPAENTKDNTTAHHGTTASGKSGIIFAIPNPKP